MPEPNNPSTLRPFAYVLAVQDLDRSTAYFRDVLGFREEWADARAELDARGESVPSRNTAVQRGEDARKIYLRVSPGLRGVDLRGAGSS